MRVVIVDASDNVVGAKERSELAPGDMYRVTGLWLTNSKGEILMAQRPMWKKKDPGTWNPAVAGTVDEGEGYDDNVVKETEEELGLSIVLDELVRGPKMHMKGKDNDYFTQWYLYRLDKPAEAFEIAKDEVVQVKWFTREELKVTLEEHPERLTFTAPQYLPIMLEQSI